MGRHSAIILCVSVAALVAIGLVMLACENQSANAFQIFRRTLGIRHRLTRPCPHAVFIQLNTLKVGIAENHSP